MYVCSMYVCVYVYMYIYIYVYTYTFSLKSCAPNRDSLSLSNMSLFLDPSADNLTHNYI